MSVSPIHPPRVFILRHCVDPAKAWLRTQLNRRSVKPRSTSLNNHSPSSSAVIASVWFRKSPFKLWFFSPPPRFFFIILHVAITCRGDLIVCSFLLFVFPFALRMGEDGRGWKQAHSPSTNTGQVEVSTASDSVPGAELHGQEPA